MTRSRTDTRALPHPHALGVLMLGAALALAPVAGQAQDAQATQPADAAAGQAAPVKNASPAANTTAPEGKGAATATTAGGAGGDGSTQPSEASGGAAASGATAASGDGATGTGQLRQAGGVLRTAEGADVGTVLVTETESGVMHFVLDVAEGTLPPGAQRAIHIHENGACEGPTFESAGGHLAGDREHGVHSANGPHPGDLPNITMGASGALHTEYFLPGVLMDQIMDDNGSAVIIHSEVDDYTSQPSGNAGDRIVCAVLELEG